MSEVADRPGWTFSPEVVEKARRYLDEGRVTRSTFDGCFWVRGSNPKRRYRVQTDADAEAQRATWITCTCPHGGHALGSARCSHAVAVLLSVRDRLPLAVTEK